MPDGVKVAQLTVNHLVMVRIHVRQPFYNNGYNIVLFKYNKIIKVEIMSKKLTDIDIDKIADLIKIKIPLKDRAGYTKQLNTVLEAADVLAQVDVSNVKPTSQTHGLENITGDDVVEKGLNINLRDKYFIVNRVIKSE